MDRLNKPIVTKETIKNMEDMKSLYFWRGPRWKERERLKEYKSKLYRVLEIFSSVSLGIMILLMEMEIKLPVWCTVTGFRSGQWIKRWRE